MGEVFPGVFSSKEGIFRGCFPGGYFQEVFRLILVWLKLIIMVDNIG